MAKNDIPMMLDGLTLKAMIRIVWYLEDSERKNFEERHDNGEDLRNHIYPDAVVLKEWLLNGADAFRPFLEQRSVDALPANKLLEQRRAVRPRWFDYQSGKGGGRSEWRTAISSLAGQVGKRGGANNEG